MSLKKLAISQGKKTYHGKPCPSCKGTERDVTNSACINGCKNGDRPSAIEMQCRRNQSNYEIAMAAFRVGKC